CAPDQRPSRRLTALPSRLQQLPASWGEPPHQSTTAGNPCFPGQPKLANRGQGNTLVQYMPSVPCYFIEQRMIDGSHKQARTRGTPVCFRQYRQGVTVLLVGALRLKTHQRLKRIGMGPL